MQQCERCGCSEYNACHSEEQGPCGWSLEKPGWCTFCAEDPQRLILYFGLPFGEIVATRFDFPKEGQVASLVPLLLGQAKITVGPMDDRKFYDEEFMYERFDDALEALEDWLDGDGEPGGWNRHKPSDRRRPGGDPTREEVRA